MDVFDKLDLSQITPRLVEIFNDNKNGEIFSGLTTRNSVVITNVMTGKVCYTLSRPDEVDGKYILYGGMNKKCSDNSKSGTQNLENIIKFGKIYGYDSFEIINDSKLKFMYETESGIKDFDINLTLIKLLTIGNSWYSQFGFNNENTKANEPEINHLINLTFEEFSRFEIPFYSEFIEEYFTIFSRTCFEITPIKICEYFKNIQYCLNSLCPLRVCENIELLEIQVTFMTKMLFFIFCVIDKKTCDIKKYKEIVNKKLLIYKWLELSFNLAHGKKSKHKFRYSKTHKNKRKSNFVDHKRIKENRKN